MNRWSSPIPLPPIRHANWNANVGVCCGSLNSYGEAVWWTAMIMTTMGSEYWPQTSEGRFLTWLLAIYAFTLFGYITATIATFFLGPTPG